MSRRVKVEPDLAFIRELRGSGGESLKKCYQCATCSVVCSLSGEEGVFPRKEMLFAQWGLKDRLMAGAGVWLCHQCNDCTTYCPRGARPGDVLAAVRAAAFRSFAFPAFMGRALASPAALPLLVLVPVAVLLAIIFCGGGLGFTVPPPPAGTEGGYFKFFLPHGILEGLFIAGNVLIFAFAAAGLVRFWKGLREASPGRGGPGFLPSLFKVALEILGHGRFRKCDAGYTRSWAHLLVFFGFVGAMATAGLALLDMTLLGHNPPIPFFHPIKILGNASGLALIAGCLVLMFRRLGDKEKAGSSGYSDWLFLVVLFVVALTGMLIQVVRRSGPFEAAYAVYFVHLVAVFFLLWYAPYSKFAHMFYRTLALVHAGSILEPARPASSQAAAAGGKKAAGGAPRPGGAGGEPAARGA